MVLGNSLPKVLDNGDCDGRNGAMEMYVCGVLKEIGV